MSDTQGSDDATSVLRPFEGATPEPLPPIEPSRVVPEDRAPEVPDVITPDDVVNAPGDAPVEAPVPPIESVEPDIEEIWAAVESEEDPDDAMPAETADELDDAEPAPAESEDDLDTASAEVSELDDGAAPDDVDTATDHDDTQSDDVDTAADDEIRLADDPSLAAAPPDGGGSSDTVTLPRKAFLGGLGAVGVLLIALLALWQTADGGDSSTVLAGEADPADVATTDTLADPTDDTEIARPDAGADPADLAASEARTAELETEVDGLEAQVDVLEGELASVPPPSLPGDAIHRIPVASGSKFVSATDVSVAVVSPFGGYANINPATDSVTAAGVVAGGATRVIRTGNSVWVTNYAEDKVIRIDPQANSVAAAFDFVGPDGLAKFQDYLLVASFDGEFLGGLDPNTGVVGWQLALGGKPTDVLVTSENGVWVALFDTGELVRVDPVTQEIIDRVLVGAGPVGLTASPEGIWVANHNEGTVVLVDPTTASVSETIEVGEGPTELIAHRSSIWVTVTDAGDLVEIDGPTREIIGRTSLGGPAIGGGPVGIDRGAGSLWVAMDGEDSVVRIALPE